MVKQQGHKLFKACDISEWSWQPELYNSVRLKPLRVVKTSKSISR